MHRKNIEKIYKSVIIISALSMSIFMVGCGKQEAEPVMSEAVEEVAPVEEEEPVEAESAEEEPIEEEESLPDELEENEEDAYEYELTGESGTSVVIYDSDTYESPNPDAQVISSVYAGEVVTFHGIVRDTNWVLIQQQNNGVMSYIDGTYISATVETDEELEATIQAIMEMNAGEQHPSQPAEQTVQQPTQESTPSTGIFMEIEDDWVAPTEGILHNDYGGGDIDMSDNARMENGFEDWQG